MRAAIALLCLLALPAAAAAPEPDVAARAGQLIGLDFSAAEIDTLLPDLADQLESFLTLRALALPNAVPPALVFDPRPVGWQAPAAAAPPRWSEPGRVSRPASLETLAFADLGTLGALLRSGAVSSTELTRLSLDRLERFDPELHCVITLMEERALAAAARADSELAAGRYRGPLHGIPYGVKDLLAVAGAPTTWGAAPYADQVLDSTATVVRKLDAAGAVLVAKLSLGALAWGDVWFGGTTRNPWRVEQGSSGSSAGSASAVSAGLVPFAIGSETWGSIVSPCTRCGVTGLRPSFGRVSREGAMALSWSMDKLGPIARSVEDCARVFDAIRGSGGPREADAAVHDAPFPYAPALDLRGLRIGYLADDFAGDYAGAAQDSAALAVFRGLGVQLIPIALPEAPVASMAFLLSAEAATAFDGLTLSGRDDLLVRQGRFAWPNVFRAARYIPAVEYLEANRARWRLLQAMAELFAQVDVYLSPSFEGDNLLLTNLSGHPSVVLPNGFTEPDQPSSFTLVGRLDDEATLLGVAAAYERATDWHRRHPPAFDAAPR